MISAMKGRFKRIEKKCKVKKRRNKTENFRKKEINMKCFKNRNGR